MNMDVFLILLSNTNHNIWTYFHKQYNQQKMMKTITENTA